MTKFKFKSLICTLLAVAMVMSLPIMSSIFAETKVDLTEVDLPAGTMAWGGAGYGTFIDTIGDPNITFDWDYIRNECGNKCIYLYGNLIGTPMPEFNAGRDIPDVYFPDDVAIEIEDYATRTIVWNNGHPDCDPVGTRLYATKTNADGTVTKYVLQDDGTFKVETGTTASDNTGTTNSNNANSNTGNTNTSTGNSTTTGTTYDDVKPGAWYYEAVMAMTDGGLVSGYGNGKFGPNDPITLVELEVILTRLTGLNIDHDWGAYNELNTWEWNSKTYGLNWTSEPWFWDYYITCGIMNYTHGVYASNSSTQGWAHQLTRFETITMLYNVFAMSDETLEKALYDKNVAATGKTRWTLDDLGDKTDIVAFAEANYVSTRSDFSYKVYDPILFAYDTGLVNGIDSKHSFGLNNSITRAELCQILYNSGLIHAGDFTGADTHVYLARYGAYATEEHFYKLHPTYHAPGTSWNGNTKTPIWN